MVNIEIATDGAAFRDADGNEDERWEAGEVVRILRKLANEIEASEGAMYSCNLLDINGNKVGKYRNM